MYFSIINDFILEGYKGEDFESTKGESCRIHGHLEVNRVSGSIHIAPGKTINIDGHLVHDIRGMNQLSHDTTHTVHHLSFGDEFPGQKNPLDDTEVNYFILKKNIFKTFSIYQIEYDSNAKVSAISITIPESQKTF